MSGGGGGVKPCKVVLLGDSSVGKSSLVVRFVEGSFTEQMSATVGAAYLAETVRVQGQAVKLEIWDTAGQERYRSLTPLYYKGALGAVVVFDLTAKHSLKAAESWILELQKQGEDSLVIALAGNKADLKNKAEISEQDVNNLRAKYPKIEIYKETSAKTGANVKEIFEALAEEYLKIQANRRPSDAVDDLIASLEAKQKKDRNCCK